MEKEKPRLARLTAILTQLQSKRMVTARHLAERHSVSIRTIYRDIRTLEQSGIPILVDEGKGYHIMEGYKMAPVMFTEEEANALVTAEQLVNNSTDQSFSEAYRNAVMKIKSVMKLSQKEKTELLASRIQIRENQDNEKTSAYLIDLQSAIVNYKITWIDYQSLEQKKTQRTVEPFAIYNAKNNWILIAYCQLRKAFRAFRLDCIQKLILTDEVFEKHDMTLEDYFEICRKNREKN